jgi:L-malate glycosyltransferase
LRVQESVQDESRNYRILLLSDINSPHTQKWALSFAGKGFQVGLFSFNQKTSDWFKDKENIFVLYAPAPVSRATKLTTIFRAPSILLELWSCIKKFNPHILHAHYASNYGLFAALSGFHPMVISVWGNDVFKFPKKSPIHKKIFRFILHKADKICSTSFIMKEEIKKYTAKDIIVIPFGVDMNIFKPYYAHHVFKDGSIVIGTVKKMEKECGISYLIEAFPQLIKRLKGYNVKLLIVGKGSQDIILRKRVKDLNIEGDTVFTGFIPSAEIPFYQNMLTIAVFPSLSESFGVSVVEAMACEKPVIVSDTGGLPEVVENGITGLVVPKADVEKLVNAMEKLVIDGELRNKLGRAGRQRVEKLFNWEKNLSGMISIYDELMVINRTN